MSTIEARIIDLYATGMTQEHIAEVLRTGRHRISRTIRFFQQTGMIARPLPVGRPRKVTDEIMDFLDVRTVQDARITGDTLKDEIMDRFGIQLSACLINQIRSKLSFKYQAPRHIQLLNPKQIEDRVAFCRKMLAMPPETLGLINFSDESRIVLGTDKQWVWYRRGENNISANVPKEKFPPSLMIFAVIGISYKSRLLFIDGTVNADRYIQNIDQLGFINELDAQHGPFSWIFQQDGATCHTAQATMEWLEENCDVINDWPSNSPDLSPIELLWAILKRMVKKIKPKTLDELQIALTTSWNMIQQSTIDRLCHSFRARMQLCLDHEGRSISRFLFILCDKAAMGDFVSENKRHQPWTIEEDNQLLLLHRRYGNKWKLISRAMPNRNSCQVKNRWYVELSKRISRLSDNTQVQLQIRADLRRNHPVSGIPLGDDPSHISA